METIAKKFSLAWDSSIEGSKILWSLKWSNYQGNWYRFIPASGIRLWNEDCIKKQSNDKEILPPFQKTGQKYRPATGLWIEIEAFFEDNENEGSTGGRGENNITEKKDTKGYKTIMK